MGIVRIGCQLQACALGQIRRNGEETACIPLAECPDAICLQVDGVNYAEGQLMEKDACHAWYHPHSIIITFLTLVLNMCRECELVILADPPYSYNSQI